MQAVSCTRLYTCHSSMYEMDYYLTYFHARQFGKVYKALMKKESQAVYVAVKRVDNIFTDFQKVHSPKYCLFIWTDE